MCQRGTFLRAPTKAATAEDSTRIAFATRTCAGRPWSQNMWTVRVGNPQQRRYLADRQQPVSKRERKRCQNLMTRGIMARDLSSRGERLRTLATPCDKPTWPFKPRVVGSIPTRLTSETPRKLGLIC